jgi:hypothetical protein
MKQTFWLPITAVASFVFLYTAPAQSSSHDFYKTRTIHTIVGFAAEEVQRIIGGLVKLEPAVVAKLKEILTKK